MAGMLKARLPELRLDRVNDPRKFVKRWQLARLLRSALLAMMAGAKSLSEVEELTDTLAPAIRRALGLWRRVPDTTLRDVLCRLDPQQLRECLHRAARAARRRKALPRESLPFHAVAIDGKVTALPCCDERFAQRHLPDEGAPYGLMRTATATLVTAPGRPCIDASSIPAPTNEVGHFAAAFEHLVDTYGDLFRLVTYDAGGASEANARLVVEADKDYLFRIKNESWYMVRMAQELIDPDEVVAHSVDVVDNTTTVTRKLALITVQGHWAYGRTKQGNIDPDASIWEHARTFLRVESVRNSDGEVVSRETRFFVSSLKSNSLTPNQWLDIVRRHWGVECNHNTLDTAFEEDDRPWITGDPQGMLAVLLLRRIAYTLLALFRSVTQRSEHKRRIPWKALLRWVFTTLVGATHDEVEGLRTRKGHPALG